MRVDGLNIVLRQRPPWEAADLGMGLVRRHARLLFSSWALATLPVFLLLHLTLTPFGYAWLAGVLFWWLKPAFDRLPIFVLSRGILGQQVSLKQTLQQLGWNWSRLWPWLLWRRLHPARSLLMAMDFLEQPEGKARGERARLLARWQASAPSLIWIVGAHLELMLWGSLIVFALMLVPVEFLDDSLKAMYDMLLEEPPPWVEFLQNSAYWIALLVIEPFYVGAGFALYLNRRTELEAWDIELAFHRLARRVSSVAASVLLAAGLLLGMSAAQPVIAAGIETRSDIERAEAEQVEVGRAKVGRAEVGRADIERVDEAQAGTKLPEVESPNLEPADRERQPQQNPEPEQNQQPKNSSAPAAAKPLLQALLGDQFETQDAAFSESVERVFRDSDLNPKKTVGRWEVIDKDDSTSRNPTPAWARTMGLVIAFLVENGLWLLLAILLIWLLLHSRRWWADWVSETPPPAQTADSPLLDPRAPKALPADVPEAVRQLWREGQSRAALALLYRGAVDALIKRLSQGLPPGATEAEVLRSARRLNDQQLSPWLAEVVKMWQTAAYGHRLPELQSLESLLAAWPTATGPSTAGGSA